MDSARRLFERASYRYRIIMMFMFDSGIRAPTELMNVKRKDIKEIAHRDTLELHIRDETSKTFGRKIKLMLCSKQLKEYLEKGNFDKEDFLFNISPRVTNQYLNRLAEKVFGKDLIQLTENNTKKNLTMYDFRHSSACYWMPRYKSESALKYRFGWKKSDMIYYYTELLGMKDTIEDDDMLIDATKSELEKQLEQEKKERELLQEQLTNQNDEMKKIRDNLDKSQTRDDIILRVLQGLAKKGKLNDVVEIVKEEGLARELMEMG